MSHVRETLILADTSTSAELPLGFSPGRVDYQYKPEED